ncbi:PREDICTED: microsomal glutathione S-transferase 1 isoform X2 [Drosophila arizonae]|uniref:Microsomal glutathione S-transferase 1 n=1 Tax=Drosophila arizonae TaxID=7263 RepID=A0ABM1PUV4_DROAR|nr:PREDICTED: microsomal glutathione S-transferase 1 isoform X2 [Drosophila arizonae]XP_017964689.1 microsomal glutathione S-transferase 1 isoform X2 [Drosophila navojoa]
MSNTSAPTMHDKLTNMELLTLDNPVFCCYLFWATVLVVKMLLMSLLTALQRFRYKVFPNEEDLFFKNIEVQFDDPHVERVRRAHRNDMENILPYFIMALIYVCTNPNPLVACNLFRVAAIARIVHTLVYALYPVPQPSRILAFATMLLITFYMAAVVALRTLRFI